MMSTANLQEKSPRRTSGSIAVASVRHALFLRLNLNLCSGAVRKKQTTKTKTTELQWLFARTAAEIGTSLQ